MELGFILYFMSKSFNYQLLSVLHRLEILLLPFLSLILLLQVGLDGFVLCIEVAHILQRKQTGEVLHPLFHSDLKRNTLLDGRSTYGHQIFDHIHVWQGVDFGRFACVGVNFVQTGQCVASINVHCT